VRTHKLIKQTLLLLPFILHVQSGWCLLEVVLNKYRMKVRIGCVPLWVNFFCLPTSLLSLQTATFVGLPWHRVFCSSTLGSDLPWDMTSFDMQVEENLIPLLQDHNIKMQVRPFFRLQNFCYIATVRKNCKNFRDPILSRLFSPHFVRTMCINMCGVECLERKKVWTFGLADVL